MDNYRERIEAITKINRLYYLQPRDIRDILMQSQPIYFDGHFGLNQRHHSNVFFRYFCITHYPWLVHKISQEMIAWVKSQGFKNINVVLGSLLHAFDIAREFNPTMITRAVYPVIDKNGVIHERLLDGLKIYDGERVLIVLDDATATLDGIKTLIDLARSKGGKVIGICTFALSSLTVVETQQLKAKYAFHSIVEFDLGHQKIKDCPFCQKGHEFVQGSEFAATNSTPIQELLERASVAHMPC